MNIVDIGLLVIILLCMLIGWKRGVIKSLFKLIGFVIIAIISYSLKGVLASWLIGFMPFFDFGGIFAGVKAMNILVYEIIAFAIIFVVLYCVLNVIVSLAGLFDKLLKSTIILALPDKILGAIVGFIEGAMIVFVGIFVLSQLPQTQNYVFESNYGSRILNRTPIIRVVLSNSTLAAEDIYKLVDKYKDEEDKTNFNIEVMQTLIKYKIITADQAQKLEEDNKLGLEYVKFS